MRSVHKFLRTNELFHFTFKNGTTFLFYDLDVAKMYTYEKYEVEDDTMLYIQNFS